jgi:Dyp-type peroxidase family
VPEDANPPVRLPITPSDEPVREAPAPEPLHCGTSGLSHPDASNEPVLNVDNIQGNILGGFNKDFQAFVLFALDPAKIAAFKEWLAAIRPFVATSAEVLGFNRLFKEMRSRRQAEPTTLKVTWINIAFSFQGIRKLIDGTNLDANFEDQAFREGLSTRSLNGILGDPSRDDQREAEGHPDNWVIGGTKEEVDVIIIVASDEEAEVDEEATDSTLGQIVNGSSQFKGGVTSLALNRQVKVQHGRNLPADKNLAGHEHFGFLDGVSQPGVRGRLSNDPHDVLTPRQNANNRDQGKPGQELIWPGEFVFGYPQGPSNPQDAADPKKKFQSAGPISTAGPDWADDGSFLVLRRLRQNVGLFHRFLHDTAAELGVPKPPKLAVPPPRGTPLDDSPADVVGARLVGRWRSGAPVMRTVHSQSDSDPLKRDQDNPFLANDDCANNNFEFQDNTQPLPLSALRDPFDCSDQQDPESSREPFQPARKDDQGLVCPFTGHIRKAYPRDDKALVPDRPLVRDGKIVTNDEGEAIVTNEDDTQTHRILRRGIPFGPASNSMPARPASDDFDKRPPKSASVNGGRGLVFLAYQTSIKDQFEFIIRNWVNNPEFKELADEENDLGVRRPENERGGHDPVIGQNDREGEARLREFTVAFQDARGERIARRVTTGRLPANERDWVVPTGGEYFFAPSIEALRLLAE